MDSSNTIQETGCRNTRRALLWMHVLNEPMVAIYTLLPFILVKDLGANVLQVSLFVSLRPILTFFSYFWGNNLPNQKTNLLSHVMRTYVLAYLPFVLFSWSGNIWLILISAGLYQLFHRASLPGWIEILQQNLPTKTRESIFSLSFVLGFIFSGTIGVFLGFLLDSNPNYLRGLLCVFSLIGLSNLFLLKNIPMTYAKGAKSSTNPLSALKQSLYLMRNNPNFWIFQIAFTIGGGALMLMSSSLSFYYANVLALSHTQVTVARFVWMAIGVMCTSFFWKKGLERVHINLLSKWILLGFGVFALAMLCAQKYLVFFFVAFLFYGAAQSGSHLVWNLSGPIFAKGDASIPYTKANILMVGIRGLLIPVLGGILATTLGAQMVIVMGLMLCFTGALVLPISKGKKAET